LRVSHGDHARTSTFVQVKCRRSSQEFEHSDTVRVSDVSTERNDAIDSDRPWVTRGCIDFRRAPREQLLGEVLTETAVAPVTSATEPSMRMVLPFDRVRRWYVHSVQPCSMPL
jgi:hypothetical protein